MAKIELVATEENFSPKVGDFFMQKDSKEIYILAKTSSDGYILIYLMFLAIFLRGKNRLRKSWPPS